MEAKPHIYPYKGRWYVSLYGKEYARPDNRVNVHFPTLEKAVTWVYYPNEKKPRTKGFLNH